ncbi:Fic family protein [Compostibacter hankyongensis]|uniref:Fido domain-containing protein n=1 Tax=Compostibacter hankyongensis TaxID=1007089 RepID=A0ABP8GAQ1_9BACT
MAKSANSAKDLREIVLTLSVETGGLSIGAIEAKLTNPPDRRTLQRRLKELIVSGELVSSGKGRATRYELAKVASVSNPDTNSDLLPLSGQAREIRQYVSQPQQKRQPVGYNRSFLDNYQPNSSSYLTKQEKERLAGLGVTAQMNAPAGTYAKQILQQLLIDLAWNSSRLEGNTYSLLDTQRLLDQGVSANDKSASEAQMILNHKDAIEFIVNTADIGFNRYTVLSLHALLSNNLLPNPAASGSLRTHGVGIAGSVYTPTGTPQLIEEMFELMLGKAAQILDPFEQAFFIMVQLPYLQPFDDVNKRVSRLAANIPLNKKNLAPLSFVEVPDTLYIDGLLGVYELNRVELLKDVFLWAYDRSAKQYAVQRQSLGEPDPFRMQYRDLIRSLISEIITAPNSKAEAIPMIQERALKLPESDQEKFVQTVENELVSLHDGNFARYFVTPSQFKNWQKIWSTI